MGVLKRMGDKDFEASSAVERFDVTGGQDQGWIEGAAPVGSTELQFKAGDMIAGVNFPLLVDILVAWVMTLFAVAVGGAAIASLITSKRYPIIGTNSAGN